ncbi:hypothetical protein DL764_000659 [Monosporascus ibericus]|uniref:Nonsense-mediated mRNA decay factor n=1 Tax=Monosporascus ibericus TaxID=155417 RepID=A0A4Q4TSP4_9PEZI|nr:hypothetical protein DL764_000659 [Monosporascus ibericus]
METPSPREIARASYGDALKHRKDIVDKAKSLERERGNVNYTARFEEIEQVLAQMRLACMQAIFHDFEYADSKNVEYILWSAHTYLNTEYRHIVGRLAQNQVVQKRKLEKLYRDFLKTSQSFYRAYIQRLSGRFYIAELRQAAQGLEVEPTETPVRDSSPPPQLREMLLKSCHSSLNHLGDLARYRCQASDKISKAAFDTSLSYYCLANLIDPADGAAHHQMAVLYRLSGQHLDIVYHFHRSISITKPHQLGLENLEKEFRAIKASQNARRFSPKDPSEAMVAWFVRLHAFYFEGVNFSQQQELEEEVLHRLELALKAEGFETILMKIVLTNIAGYSVAKMRLSLAWTANGSRYCQFVLRFTIRTISLLLRLLKAALQDDQGHPVDVEAGSSESPIGFGPVLTKLLPLFRIYIAWMYSLRADLIEYRMYLESHITDVYRALPDILTSLNSFIVPAASTIQSQYLLPEDMEAMGLRPLSDQRLPLFLRTEAVRGTGAPTTHRVRKPTKRVLGRQYKPHTETIWRIRDIVCCGALLAGSADFPLGIVPKFRDGRGIETWIYTDEAAILDCLDETGIDSILDKLNIGDVKSVPEGNGLQLSRETRDTQNSENMIQPSSLGVPNDAAEDSPQTKKGKSAQEEQRGPVSDLDLSGDSAMIDMVNKLLDPTEGPRPESSRAQPDTSYGMDSSTANEIFAQLSSSPAQPSPVAKSIPSLPWGYFYTPTPHPPASQGPVLSTTDDFYKPRTAVPAFEALGSPHARQNTPWRQGPGDGADPAAATRKAAHEKLASALYAQFGTHGNKKQGADESSSPVGGNPQQDASVLGTSSASGVSTPSGSVRSPANNLERPGSRHAGACSSPKAGSGLAGAKNTKSQQSPPDISNWPDQFRTASSRGKNDFGFPQQAPRFWEGPASSNSGDARNYSSWVGQEPATTGSSLLFSHPSSIFMGTPGGHNQRAPPNLVACNGNFFDATTPFGRIPGYNSRDDPTHFRNQLRQVVGEVDDSYDKQILQSALLDDNSQPRSKAK